MKIHIVEANETLTAIAAQHGIELDALSKSNPHVSSYTALEVGQKIMVPSTGVKIAKKATLAKDSVEKAATLPKWWYEEVRPATSTIGEGDTTSQSEGDRLSRQSSEDSHAPYPFIDPAMVPALYPTSPAQFDAVAYYASTPAYPAQVVAPAQQIPYVYGAPASTWYDPVMTILATNRIPIPPRVTNINGNRGLKVPISLLQLDESEEDWEDS